ncbi:hypothetical protein OS493_009440 [Desmophyllum pertusum]|uniref:Uncharacterized protein n=1 Tax=Desmophyllum pertusum TaxID=174260 RepID=A0A9W9Z2Y7_9CNID|nr:hypothetical protein OS493_009440 [Desmophyllum pertusum]
MASIKVLVFLLGAMLLCMGFQRASAASLFDDIDEDDLIEDNNQDDSLFDLEAMFDASKSEEKDSNDDPEKRRVCANIYSNAFCRRVRTYCDSNLHKGRIAKSKCRQTCGCRHG